MGAIVARPAGLSSGGLESRTPSRCFIRARTCVSFCRCDVTGQTDDVVDRDVIHSSTDDVGVATGNGVVTDTLSDWRRPSRASDATSHALWMKRRLSLV